MRKKERELIKKYGEVRVTEFGRRITLETNKGHKIELGLFKTYIYSILIFLNRVLHDRIYKVVIKQYRIYDNDKPKIIREKIHALFHKHDYEIYQTYSSGKMIGKCKHCNKKIEMNESKEE